MRAVLIGACLAFAINIMADQEAHLEKVLGKAFMPAVATHGSQMSVRPSVPVPVPIEPADAPSVGKLPVSNPDKEIAQLRGEVYKLEETNDRMKAELESVRSQMEGPQARGAAGTSDAKRWTHAIFGFGCLGYGLGATFLVSIIYRMFINGNRRAPAMSMNPWDGQQFQSSRATSFPLIPCCAGLRTIGVVMNESRGGGEATRYQESTEASSRIADMKMSMSGATALRFPTSAMDSLSEAGYAVLENFVPASTVELLRQDVAHLSKHGKFNVAGVGDASTNRMADDVRRCEQCFIYPKFKYVADGYGDARSMLYPMLDGVRSQLEAGTGIELDAFLTEGAYMSYPQGGYYKRHIDSYPGTPQEIRKFSYLLYCNTDWKPSDGGCLRIHLDGGTEVPPTGAAPAYHDVEPRAGTLVVFRSDIPHEALPTTAPRLAIAGWFNAPPKGSSDRRTTIAALGGALILGSAIKFGVLGGDK